jgi:hypothetical protein
MFLSEQERKLSRLTCSPPSSMDGDEHFDFFNYEPNLYLQGFVVGGESSYLPFTMADLRQSYLPPCIIHISSKEVRWVEMNIPYFIRVKDDNEKKSRRRCVFTVCSILLSVWQSRFQRSCPVQGLDSSQGVLVTTGH